MHFLLGLLLVLSAVYFQQTQLAFLNHNRPVLDAHNCYPEGLWTDRLERALTVGFPVAIEQDLAWYIDPATNLGQVVVTHEARTTGKEPTLREHFFEHVRPIVERELRQNDRARWPLIILHFDFKSNDPQLLQSVWNLLDEYRDWITTVVKTADPHDLAPFDPKPLLVLTEDSNAQEDVFFKRIPVGAQLRVFGSAHTKRLPGNSDRERAHFAATLPPDELLVARPTNYRRWWNNSWSEVEEGGQVSAGDWTPADVHRLQALVDHAHRLGFWIRFYTLDGFSSKEDRGWNRTYNFGSREAVLKRWRAALDAGVDMIATDQYEDLSAIMAQTK
jgi:hypothetical protein